NPDLWGSHSMTEQNQDAGELWDRILAGVNAKAPPGCFDTWFRPLQALRLNGSVLELTFPNETFHALFTENFLGLLRQVTAEVSVASGSPCLDTFSVFSAGPVLLYAAEDSATALRTRVETLAQLHKVDINRLDVHIITVDSLRLDRPDHQDRLESTLDVYKPALLVLDPLVRVHAIDENVAGQVSMLLGYLRSLQRKTGAA